jgi:hypothetical protein
MAGALALYYGVDPKAGKWQTLFSEGIREVNAWNNRNMNEMTRKEGYSTTNLSSREPDVNIPNEIPSS